MLLLTIIRTRRQPVSNIFNNQQLILNFAHPFTCVVIPNQYSAFYEKNTKIPPMNANRQRDSGTSHGKTP